MLELDVTTRPHTQFPLASKEDEYTKTRPALAMQPSNAEIIAEEGFLSSDGDECPGDISPPTQRTYSTHAHTKTQSTHGQFAMHGSKIRSSSLSSLSPMHSDTYANVFATGDDSSTAALRRESCPERGSNQKYGSQSFSGQRRPAGVPRPRSGSLNDTHSRNFFPLSTEFEQGEESFFGLPNPRKSSAPCFSANNSLHDPLDSQYLVGRRLTADSADSLAQLFHNVDLASVHNSPTHTPAGLSAYGGSKHHHYDTHTGVPRHSSSHQQHRRGSSHGSVDELNAELVADFLESANSGADQELKAILAVLNSAEAHPKQEGISASSLPEESHGVNYPHVCTDGEDGDAYMSLDMAGNDSEGCEMENGGGKCNKARPRRPRNQLARQYVCPLSHTGCERRYEAWRSLQHHLWAHHSIRFRKLDYDRLFPQLSIHQIISSQDLLYPHLLREKLQASNQKYHQQNTIRPRPPANSVPASGISSPSNSSPQNVTIKNIRNVAPYSANSSPVVRARQSFVRTSEKSSMWGGSMDKMGTLMEDGISRGISSMSTPSLPVRNQMSWDNLLQRLQM